MYFQWKPYVSVAERRKKAKRTAAKSKANGLVLSPVTAARGAIAKTFWGKAWCENLERYSDFSNRLPRGRTYVRNGAVIDLRIAAGQVSAQVVGSRLYKVAVHVSPVEKSQWQAIGADCAGSMDSVVELLQGRLSKNVMERICRPRTGLFPAPQEMRFTCTCPDWAEMCKHIAAVFYGIGARLDEQPELLFMLRRVDPKDLVARAGAGLIPTKKVATRKVLDESMLGAVFGIEIADTGPSAKRENATSVNKRADVAKTRTVKRKTGRRTGSAPSSARKRSGKLRSV